MYPTKSGAILGKVGRIYPSIPQCLHEVWWNNLVGKNIATQR